MMQLSDTRILVAIQVVADDSAAADLMYLVAIVTGLIPTLAQAARKVEHIAGWVVDLAGATVFTYRVFTIGFKALAYGFVGVNL